MTTRNPRAVDPHRAASGPGRATAVVPAIETVTAPAQAVVALAAGGGAPAITRFAPPQRHQAILALQRTAGNFAVQRLLQSTPPRATIQRDATAGARELVEVASTPPEVSTPPVPTGAPVTWGTGGQAKDDEKPEVEASVGGEVEGTAEKKAGEETEKELAGSAKFEVETTVPIWKQAPGIGPVMLLKAFSFEQSFALTGHQRKLLPKYAMGAALKALSLDFDNIKAPLQIPGKVSVGFDASVFSAAEVDANKVSFKVGGQIEAEGKYQFPKSPIFINGKLAGQIYWGNLTQDGVSAAFQGASYSGFVGLGARF